jgi:streptomycin 6-kinase
MDELDPWIERWNLTLDGDPFRSNWGVLAPVRHLGSPAMLKVALDPDEEKGGHLLAWWNGDGAAQVYEVDGAALLMERLTGERSLNDMSRGGEDDEATVILCEVAARLHAPRSIEPPPLVSLETWFKALWPEAAKHGGAMAHAAVVARKLLATEQDRVVLHGDLHHGNILDAGERGWLAIDPKFLYGERAFDFVNILRNPDEAVSLTPGRFARQVDLISDVAGLDRTRFLEWIVAFTGLSAAWTYGGNAEPHHDLAVNALAVDLLERPLR